MKVPTRGAGWWRRALRRPEIVGGRRGRSGIAARRFMKSGRDIRVGGFNPGRAGRESPLDFGAVEVGDEAVVPVHGQHEVLILIDRVGDLKRTPQVNRG